MVALESEDDVLAQGDEAPPFELPGADGETHALSDFADREAALVVFTCNHCPYAQAKFDELNALAAEYDDLAVVGVNSNDAEAYPDDSLDRMTDLVADGTIRYDAYLRDESQDVAAAYGARCTPDPFLLDNDSEARSASEQSSGDEPRDGTFRVAYHGRLDDALNPDDEPSEREMQAHVEALLAGEEVTAEEKPSRGCSIKWTPGNEPDYWEA
ncbi:thioredoxin family protein [Halomicrobium salinisoli]|uniref:thioredoxin family protein n=1 Tax=Halomicrobium salinisoli TaxID=2878391 RepID=UPI001CEFF7BF|nr:thioredoxin family protein [Halomicrobium salinisoli]